MSSKELVRYRGRALAEPLLDQIFRAAGAVEYSSTENITALQAISPT